jgi:putative FmdB family regulatory protein
MPIYEFYCKKCLKKFELLRPFSRSGEPADCPICKNNSERIMSTCISMSTTEGGIPKEVGGHTCSSCSSGNCSTCG